jgi:hypothetical protein
LLKELICKVVGDEAKIRVFAIKNLKDGLTERQDNISLVDIRDTVDIISDYNTLILYFQGGGKDISISFGGSGEYLHVSISAESPETLYLVAEKVKDIIRTNESESSFRKIKFEGPSIPDQIDGLRSMIEELRTTVAKPTKKIRCFLSYRFDQKIETMVLRLQRFLTLLDVDVISGASYEPRRISDKVMERINQSIDCVILLIAESGESAWTRDEISYANSKGIPIIPIVEENTKFESGMLGDLEYLSYADGHIGDVYIGLLEAINYIKSKLLGTLPDSKAGS